jgi:hypothetical protein
MSAYGPKRTCLVTPHMSAFGGKADMQAKMSAFDPKRIFTRRLLDHSPTRFRT